MSIGIFQQRMADAEFLTNAMLKLAKYFEENNKDHSIEVEGCESTIEVIKDNSIRIFCKLQNGYVLIGQYYAHTYLNVNEIQSNSISFNLKTKAAYVESCTDYKIEYPYEHDEARYFQYSTLYDLPQEEYYIEACEYLSKVKDYDFNGSIYVCQFYLTKRHIFEINKLLEKMDLIDA